MAALAVGGAASAAGCAAASSSESASLSSGGPEGFCLETLCDAGCGSSAFLTGGASSSSSPSLSLDESARSLSRDFAAPASLIGAVVPLRSDLSSGASPPASGACAARCSWPGSTGSAQGSPGESAREKRRSRPFVSSGSDSADLRESEVTLRSHASSTSVCLRVCDLARTPVPSP